MSGLFGQGTSSSSTSIPALSLQVPTLDPSGRKRSIFDASTSTPQPPSSFSNMFGGAAASSTSGPTSSSTAAPAPSNLFGISNTTSSAPQPTGLFGATAPSKPTGGLFLGTATTNQSTSNPAPFGGSAFLQSAPGTSTFGNFQQNINQQQPPSQQQQSGSSQIQNRDPAYFRNLLERQKKKGRFGDSTQAGRSSQLPSLNVDLGDLARRAQEIGGRAPTPSRKGADSRAHYLLAGSGVSPGKSYREFQSTVEDEEQEQARPQPDFEEDVSSRYMRDLQYKGRETVMKESMDRVYREVDAFIQESLGIDFEEQQQRIMEHFGIVPRDDSGVDGGSRASPGPKGSFARSTKKTKGLGDSGRGSTRSVFGHSALDRSMIGNPGLIGNTTSFFGDETQTHVPSSLSRGQTARDLRDKERLYIDKVEQLNQARISGESFPVMHHFAEIEQSAGGDSPRQLVDAYEALADIVKENPDPKVRRPVKERQYASTYLSDGSNSAGAVRLKKQILEGSRTHLEKAFYRDAESLVEKNPREAQLGGRPTVTNKVRAYIRVRAARRDLAPEGTELQQIGENGEYCWILIFYLLRSGYLRDAQEYVDNDPAFQSTDKRFISYLKSYCSSPERKLSRKLQEMINGEYSQRAKLAPVNSTDPYRMACYKIVGRCDLSSRNLDIVGQGVEDWIWLQFSLARENERGEEVAGDAFGLDQICDTVTEIGQKHFQKSQVESSGGYGTYFLMQIMAGMFEQAVDYLHSFSPVSAVHFAIALDYYGLLRVSDFSIAGNELLTHSTTQQPLINFVPLIAYYTAAFRTALPVAAVDYLSLICLNSDLTPASLGSAHTGACHECLRQLCLETREFAILLGDIRSDGTRIAGAIEEKAPLIKLETHVDFTKAVTLQAAAIANERGQVADAVLLYHLSEDYDNVVGILNHSLADAITLDLGESPIQLQPLKPRRDTEQMSPNGSGTISDGPQSSLSLTQSTSSPVELARDMITLYNGNASYYNHISPSNRDACGVLLQLLSARADLESSPPRYMSALETINNLNILPLLAKGSIPAIRAAASAFGSLSPLLARCAGISVVWAVRAIGGERDNLIKQGSWDTGFGGDRDAMKEQLNGMAKDLMVFAGLVKYKLPGRVYDLLTRAGGDVGMY